MSQFWVKYFGHPKVLNKGLNQHFKSLSVTIFSLFQCKMLAILGKGEEMIKQFVSTNLPGYHLSHLLTRASSMHICVYNQFDLSGMRHLRNVLMVHLFSSRISLMCVVAYTIIPAISVSRLLGAQHYGFLSFRLNKLFDSWDQQTEFRNEWSEQRKCNFFATTTQ